MDNWYSRVNKQQPFKDIDTNTNEAFFNEWKHLSNYIHQIYISLLIPEAWLQHLESKDLSQNNNWGILSKHRNYMFICADGLGRCLVCSPVAGGMWRTGQRLIRCPPIDMNKWLDMNNKQLVKDQRRLCRGPKGRHASG